MFQACRKPPTSVVLVFNDRGAECVSVVGSNDIAVKRSESESALLYKILWQVIVWLIHWF